MPPLRIIFMGTSGFAVPSLNILLENGFDVAAVVTAPDKPRGRGLELLPTPVKERATVAGRLILQPGDLKSPEFAESLRSLAPDLCVVVAFRILPREVFTIARLGTFNLHASLLPHYRGAAPINRAIMNGETETGVTTFFLDDDVDTGNILMQARVPILPEDDAGSVHDKLADVGAEIVLHTVRLIEQGKAHAQIQDPSLTSRAPKIFKEDCRIVWDRPSSTVHNQIRGLSPVPAAFTMHAGKVLKIYRSKTLEGHAEPGEIQAGKDYLHAGTSDGLLSLEEVQLEGKKRMGVAEFLRGYKIMSREKFQ